MRVVVVGGGIGGLATALALQRIGISATVHEQAPALDPTGAGIGLWPGALKSLRSLGVAPSFWDLPVCPFAWAETATADGRIITGFEVTPITDGLGYVVHRAELIEALRAPLSAATCVTGSRLTAVQQSNEVVRLTFADGSTVEADLVIGADGLHSLVRAAVIDDQPRYSGEVAYRGICDMAVPDPGLMRETQHAGWRGAVHPLSTRQVYWWVTRRTTPGAAEGAEERARTVLSGVWGWAGGLPEAVAATPAERVLRNDLYDRDPVPRWSRGRITLVGDAAHPTTPNLGLGGCMAIEDALVLARALHTTEDHVSAFAQYEAQRHARTARVVKMSRLMGRTGSLSNPVAAGVWRWATRLTPSSFAAAMLAREVAYDPGPLD